MIQFLLDDELRQVDGLAPETSLLDYLRTQLGRTGTKEGCASGDCGACTLVLAEPDGEGLRYRAVNACITPLGALHGRQLLTVESLAEGERLHPVQQAMVDCHGAQCGFCTPGIVMSLFAWRHAACAHDRESALTALSGNLCRCTGYRPILDAARHIAGEAGADRFDASARATAERLRALPAGASLDDGEQHAWLPTTLEELDTLLMNYPQARLVAGATDLALEATQALKRFPQLIHLERVAELRRLEEHPDHLLIGAARPYADCLEVLHAFPGVPELLERLGSLQIRQRGTLGGNIANASPIGDMPPVLLALDARLRLRRARQVREVPIDGFFTGYRQSVLQPGEYIEAVVIPRLVDGQLYRVDKVSKRRDDDISAVCLALRLDFDDQGLVRDARLACGGMAATPLRGRRSEAALSGRAFDAAAVAAAQAALAEDFQPIDDLRASAAYRLRVAQNLLQRALVEYTATPAEVRHA
ncbi:xanthine dehydrogenase small subunit [Pseudomonas citronellolis]|uniref:xanthine dehydrogenase small subunit n=1 Tax=Pseudomonas citronellolis TaxID=53408 RepID=UPI00209FD242|nr:xanthine dehydrogenase small subunit [Pseudomonas citronellolis]MCP1641128.1 xanthine dehydrogenase small subunit [Pseudomonas citronellolis]MCP1664046.1 xanthine dehydrogenase small subunit [Pseudomonas citronellolis]MCP1695021.1 xanthine dehydrogenase small subunit [Pseudomonas citronellolis]MCP1701881.1 xanthine dehydrogenase small subunit [Pseudomonas citronellolis]MCP1795767.1 xanthine dehydrogenase small subunit [Pseudomonas citronellolis]